MTSNVFWNPTIADERIMETAVNKLQEIAELFAQEIRAVAPVGSESRPMYRTGPYAGKWWTSRDGGALKRSVRVVLRGGENGGRNHNAWIMTGSKKAYYAKMVEHYSPFARPAANRAKRKSTAILNGR